MSILSVRLSGPCDSFWNIDLHDTGGVVLGAVVKLMKYAQNTRRPVPNSAVCSIKHIGNFFPFPPTGRVPSSSQVEIWVT